MVCHFINSILFGIDIRYMQTYCCEWFMCKRILSLFLVAKIYIKDLSFNILKLKYKNICLLIYYYLVHWLLYTFNNRFLEQMVLKACDLFGKQSQVYHPGMHYSSEDATSGMQLVWHQSIKQNWMSDMSTIVKWSACQLIFAIKS